MRQYDSYRDSGVEWIGKIPSHWEKLRIKYMLTRSAAGVWGNDEQNDENDIVCFRAADFDYPHGKLREDKITIRNVPLSQLNGRTMSVGDLLIEKSGGGDNAPVGRVVRFTYNGKATCSNFIHSISTGDGLNSNFLYYYFHAMYSNKVNLLYFNQTTGLQNLQIGDYLAQSIFTPKPVEQECIASYLDKVTAHIDSIIEAREKKIKLLEELRNAIISKAVTKGIDNNVETKDSGIEWIGRIPSHWEVCPIKWLTSRVGSGKTPQGGAEVYTTEGVMFIRSQNVYNNGLITDNIAYIPEKIHNQMLYSEVKHNDVLLNITGGSIGRACLIENEGICANVNQHVCEIRPILNKIHPAFLHNVIISDYIQNVIKACQTGGNRDELNFEQISNFMIPLPPFDEQYKISSFISIRTKQIDKTIKDCNNEIDFLKEYRSSLITEVVTGKRKVVA